jgi:hypothetical protein
LTVGRLCSFDRSILAAAALATIAPAFSRHKLLPPSAFHLAVTVRPVTLVACSDAGIRPRHITVTVSRLSCRLEPIASNTDCTSSRFTVQMAVPYIASERARHATLMTFRTYRMVGPARGIRPQAGGPARLLIVALANFLDANSSR